MKSSNFTPKNIAVAFFAALLGLPSIAVAQLTTDSLLIKGFPAVLSQEPGTVTDTEPNGAGGTTTTIDTLTTLGAPYVSATAISATDSVSGGVSTSVSFTYYFEIVDRHDGDLVNNVLVNIAADGMATGTNPLDPNTYGFSLAELSTNVYGFGSQVYDDPGSGQPNSFTLNENETITSGTVYDVNLYVLASAYGQSSSSAYIDPTVTVDPSEANDYYVAYSPNLESVPEPSTWAMLLGGLGLLAFWRKRTTQA